MKVAIPSQLGFLFLAPLLPPKSVPSIFVGEEVIDTLVFNVEVLHKCLESQNIMNFYVMVKVCGRG